MTNQTVEIIEIPANKIENRPIQKMKVAAYCRVSKGTEELLNSLDIQKAYYEALIVSNPLWENVGIFADVASGKSIKARSDFQKMLKVCRKGKIDIILTKSVSRFGRNTLDALKTLEMLRGLHVDVWFEVEGIRLLSETSHLMLEMLIGFAQEESESKSKNIKWGLKQSFQSPSSKKSNVICYGYAQDHQGKLMVDKRQAEVIRMIFRLYLTGYSLSRISEELKTMFLPSPSGKGTWSSQTLDRVLSNEKYTGNVLLQKTYVQDFLTGKQIKNSGQCDRYFIAHHHSPIISQDDFDKAQQEKKRRSNVSITVEGKRIRSEMRYGGDPFSGLLICAECGRSYRRITRSTSEGKEIVWRCASRVEHGKKDCKNSPTISQRQLKDIFLRTLGTALPDPDLLRKAVQRIAVASDGLKIELAEMDDATRNIFLREQEHRLCQSYLSGNTVALEYLFEWNYPLLRKCVFYISCRSPLKKEDKEDVIQNATLRSIQGIASYNGSYRFWAWLKKIAYHEFCRALKSIKKYACETSAEYSEWKHYEGRDDFSEWESKQVVSALLDAVNEGQRKIIIEKLFYGKALDEIGRENNICHSTVGARYRSGLKRMRKLYLGEFSATSNK